MSRSHELAAAPGISRDLAELRSRSIRSLSYRLRLSIPVSQADPVSGHVEIRFALERGESWPDVDFAPHPDSNRSNRAIHEVRVDGSPTEFEHLNGHIAIRGDVPAAGEHRIEMAFESGQPGLTRADDAVFTLFVPDRAHRVFPCFDQPDLKAPMALELELPREWTAIANAPETGRAQDGGRQRIRFAPTEPLPTYLYAFAAGQFTAQESTIGERRLTLCHPRGAASLTARQRTEVVRLHTEALAFLERYTGIDCPFAKFGFVLIPDFPFAGMEHPGAIFYRENLIRLDGTATEADRLRRANLIAHETAHQWFGNLVTMRWFDDVWLKEVFASFLADKIVSALYPESDHRLDFFLRHFPPAHAIDRTGGTRPIRRPLENLAGAGELYDALIYHKAPIAMAALEAAIGETAMREGLAAYLQKYRYANADWPALRTELARASGHDLSDFSRRWIESAGRPRLTGAIDFDAPPRYGELAFDEGGRRHAFDVLESSDKALARASAWSALFEDTLECNLDPLKLLPAATSALGRETYEPLLARIADDLSEIYWRLLTSGARTEAAPAVERVLRTRLEAEMSRSRRSGPRSAWLKRLARFALTDAGLAALESIWQGDDPGFGSLPEPLAVTIATSLALRRPDRAEEIIARQLEATRDQNRHARLVFLAPALSARRGVRDSLFDRLIADGANEIRTIEALTLLSHALCADTVLDYLEPGIAHARRLRARGDIFFPHRWLKALFSPHASADATAIIRSALDNARPAAGFESLLLETADPVFRAAAIRERWASPKTDSP